MTYKQIVKEVLQRSKLSRDCDQHLFSLVLANLDFDVTAQTAFDLIQKVRAKELPSLDSITRLRRMVQMDNPELRGNDYDLRHGKKVEKALNDLGYSATAS